MNNIFEDTIILENSNNIIKNTELRNLIQFKLNKMDFEIKDLDEMQDIIINGKKINNDINIVDFNEIELFKNLKKIELKNLDIARQQIKKINNIDEIYFRNCKIEGLDEIKYVKKLAINSSTIENINIIEKFENIEELELVNLEVTDFNFLNMLKKLQVLKIKNIKGFLLSKIDFVLPIQYISIEGIEKLESDYLIKNYPNLEIVAVDIEKQEEWCEELEKIKQQGIKILLNGIYEF